MDQTLTEATAPTRPYRTARMESLEFECMEPNYDIEVDDLHEFYANGIACKNCMGNLHPHGDSSIYETLVNQTKSAMPTMVGIGSFGTQLDGPAAMRYTESHLSRYSDMVFFDKRFLPVLDMAETYDGSEKEPLILPALLPNLLLNGSYGIAVGATSSIPAFEPDGVVELVRMALDGDEITSDLCMEHLVPTSPEGGLAFLEDDESRDELRRFFETGDGSIYWYPLADINPSDGSVLVTGFSPSYAKSIKRSLAALSSDPRVAAVDDETEIDESGKGTDMVFRVRLKTSIEEEEAEEALYEITRMFEGKQHLTFTVTERLPPPEGEAEPDVEFMRLDMPSFFAKWASWRTSLERKALERELDVAGARAHIVDGLLVAFRNLDAVIRIVRESDDAKAELRSRFELSDKQAESILNMKLRQLAKLEEKALKDERRKLEKESKRLRASHDDPVPDMQAGLDVIAGRLAKLSGAG